MKYQSSFTHRIQIDSNSEPKTRERAHYCYADGESSTYINRVGAGRCLKRVFVCVCVCVYVVCARARVCVCVCV